VPKWECRSCRIGSPDLVVESDEGVVGAGVKMRSMIDSPEVRHLTWLRDKLGDECIDTIVVNIGPEAHRRPDGIAVVPLALLGPRASRSGHRRVASPRFTRTDRRPR